MLSTYHRILVYFIYNQYIINKINKKCKCVYHDLFSALISLDFRFFDKENSESLWYRLFPQKEYVSLYNP